jgi:type II secretory pathway pseudopilin PulG
MKTLQYRSRRLSPSGMTLIEISLVIALLLGLIAVVFLGIGSYRKGSDKAKCKMQLAAAQKAVRAQANFLNLNIDAPFVSTTDAFGPGKALENEPVCPTGTTYTWLAVIPPVGESYGTCAYDDGDGTDHILVADTIKDW